MLCSPDDLASFWSAPWSVPLRCACRWLEPEEQTRADSDASAPRWLRPLCVQRWVGQAVRDRLAWMQAHPEAACYRYGGSNNERQDRSIPCWTAEATVASARETLRGVTEESLLWGWNVEVERLLRVSEAPPSLLGEETWARAALRASVHWDYRAA